MILKIVKSTNWTEEGGFHATSSWLRLATSQKQPISAVLAQNELYRDGSEKSI
jgi:hypothetical protein